MIEYSTIVVGTDGSETAAVAVRHAVSLAEAGGADLIVVHGVRMLPGGGDVVFGAGMPDPGPALAAGRDLLGRVEEEFRSAVKLRTVLRQADPVEAILQVAEAEGADLIVVGNRGMRGARRLLGSVPDRVAHRARCSVLIVNTTGLAGAADQPGP